MQTSEQTKAGLTMLTVDAEKISELHDSLANSAQELTHTLDRLNEELQRLELTWEGAATTAFTATRKRWNAEALAIKDALDTIAKITQTATDAYTRVEQANTRNWA
jgi:WXG100 family type VII secretion target